MTNTCGHFIFKSGSITFNHPPVLPAGLDADEDGLPNGWELQYGLNRLSPFGRDGASGDPDGDGLSNLAEYAAGTDPTNSASVFVLKIQTVSGQPNQKSLLFGPWASGHTYTVESKTNLLSGSYAQINTFGGPTTNGTQVTVTDLSATQTNKFYRIHISLP